MSDQHSPFTPTSVITSEPLGILSEGAIAKNWLIFAVTATVVGALAGMIAGAIIGGILGASGSPIGSIRLASALAGFAAGLPVSYLTYRWRAKRMLQEAFAFHTSANTRPLEYGQPLQ